MKELKFYICEHCGNIAVKVHNAGVPLVCCGQKMKELIPGTVEASLEKHVPAVSMVKVEVGSVAHPMSEEHYIPWVWLETSAGSQRKALSPEDAPVVTFALAEGEQPVAVYAYCNLHGLWKAELCSLPGALILPTYCRNPRLKRGGDSRAGQDFPRGHSTERKLSIIIQSAAPDAAPPSKGKERKFPPCSTSSVRRWASSLPCAA